MEQNDEKSIEEGLGQYTIVQKAPKTPEDQGGVAGEATGSSTVILGVGHGEVSNDYALVAGRYSKRPEQAEAEELFTVGAGSSAETKNALQVTVDENGTVQAVVSGNMKAGSDIEASGNIKATGDAWVGDTIYFGKKTDENSKGRITKDAEAYNITFPDLPIDDNDPVRLIDLNIDEEFFNALYS